MGDEPTVQDSSQQNQEINPWPIWGTPSSSLELGALKGHTCGTDLVQRGTLVHCNTGNHGWKIPPHKMLVKVNGQFDIVDQPISDASGKIIAKNLQSVVK
jgi:hypothetical protein